MAASKKNMEDGQENKNTTKFSDLASQACSKDGHSIEDLHPCFDFNESSDDDYIDIEVGSTMFWEAASRKLNTQRAESIEFEFDAKVMEDLDMVDSPADELFYKGRLLPLHLPPRIQMVEKLLASEKPPHQTRMTVMGKEAQSKSVLSMDSREKELGEGLIHKGLNMDSEDSVFVTPYDSAEATPYDSCEVSQELCPDLYKENFMSSASVNQAEVEAASSESSKGKINRLNMIRKAKKLLDSRQTSLVLKLKASRAYVKSLFSKTTSIKDRTSLNQRDLLNNSTDDPGHNMLSRGCMNRYMKVLKPSSSNGGIGIQREGYKVAAAVAKSLHREHSSMIEDVSRRKSFSDSLSSMMEAESHNSNSFSSYNRLSPNNNGVILKRSSSANLDMDNAIQGAIAHCKQSAHLASNNSITELSNTSSKFQRPTSNVEGYTTNGYVRPSRSVSSRIGACDQPEKPGLCRG